MMTKPTKPKAPIRTAFLSDDGDGLNELLFATFEHDDDQGLKLILPKQDTSSSSRKNKPKAKPH